MEKKAVNLLDEKVPPGNQFIRIGVVPLESKIRTGLLANGTEGEIRLEMDFSFEV
jgi:hypothetical protein